jgi:inner membrane protein
MDSLTQITLGAAVGEAVMGRKLGNRAMLWGAIGGTIPDLDVLSNLVTDEMSSLAFHRAITHSFTFALIAPLALGWLLHRTYNRQSFWPTLGLAAVAIFVLVALGSIFMPIPPWEVIKISGAVTSAIVLFPLLAFLLLSLRKKRPAIDESTSVKDWSLLMFWAIFTHPLLDACTTYGTQLFQPFWDYRVGFNNISVADPAYTFPFLLCLILALIAGRNRRWRTYFNRAGLIISSAYLLFTFYNKYQVDRVFKQSLKEEGIAYERLTTSPTILNNFLWQGTAEGDTAFYSGSYSILDKQPRVLEFITIPKQHELLAGYEEDRTVRILSWFSDDYWSLRALPDSSIQFNDLRYGTFGENQEGEPEFIFNFVLKKQDGEIIAIPQRDPPGDGSMSDAFNELMERIKGI